LFAFKSDVIQPVGTQETIITFNDVAVNIGPFGINNQGCFIVPVTIPTGTYQIKFNIPFTTNGNCIVAAWATQNGVTIPGSTETIDVTPNARHLITSIFSVTPLLAGDIICITMISNCAGTQVLTGAQLTIDRIA
jgi:hypothetical protein